MRVILAAFLALFLSFAISSPVLSATGELERIQTHRDWASMKVCFVDFCLWRALTFSKQDKNEVLCVDFHEKSNKPYIQLIDLDVPIANVRKWEKLEDYVPIRLRVDRQPIIDFTSHREMDKDARVLYYNFSSNNDEQLINQMRKGATLRMQTEVNGQTFTQSFSLAGAMAAIDRACRNAGREFSKDEDYFNESIRDSGEKLGL